jgi:hypothetical protein
MRDSNSHQHDKKNIDGSGQTQQNQAYPQHLILFAGSN